MAWKLSRAFWRFSLASLCLIVGSGIWSAPAAAQKVNAAHGDKVGRDAVKTKEFKFEIVSIKPVKPESDLRSPLWGNTNPAPDGYRSRLKISEMIMVAYADTVGIDAWIYTPLINQPKWSDDWFDIDARVSESDLAAWQNQGSRHELLRSAMQDLLKERCKLAIHAQPTELQDYKMVVGKKGPKLEATPPGFVLPQGPKLESGGVLVVEIVSGKAVLHFDAATMGDLASFESRFSNRPVHDMTGLTGRYNFTFQQPETPSSDLPAEATKFPINDFGLELKPGKYSGTTLIIDYIERPSLN
jgi:uncharacterized protein (TIGR03435 family)